LNVTGFQTFALPIYIKKGDAHLYQRPEVIYTFIVKHRHEFRVSKMCKILGVSKSGYYQWLKRPEPPQKQRKASIKGRIRRIHTQSKSRYGSPKNTALLRQARSEEHTS